MNASMLRHLTPVEEREGFWFKREDLFRPFSGTSANGAKLRQCLALVTRANPTGLVTYSSIHSPQLVHVAACGRELGLPTLLLVGGTANTSVTDEARALGAQLWRLPCARHPALLGAARRLCKRRSHMLIGHGMIERGSEAQQLYLASEQVENLPEQVDTIVVTCGSGLSLASILLGISRFEKSIRMVHVITTGPRRLPFVRKLLRNSLEWEERPNPSHPEVLEVSLQTRGGFRYDRPQPFACFGIHFHPLYEGKAFRWALKNLHLKKGRTLFWVVGAPK